MILLIYGGSGSGKSAYAEDAACRLDAGTKYYIATMKVCDDDAAMRVERHRKMRSGKGFVTIEAPVDVAKITERCDLSDSTCLLECVSNLAANEMFIGGRQIPERDVSTKILSEIRHLSGCVKDLVIVTNNVFEDGIEYDESTRSYLTCLGEVNRGLAGIADRVIEVVVGIPVTIK